MAKVLTLHIEYGSQGKHLWRDMEVSENYRLNMLGYAILATFDTMAYHMFEFNICGDEFSMPMDGYIEDGQLDMSQFKLSQMHFEMGDKFEMEYDMGESQIFNITVTNVADMPKGAGRSYPKITAGKGRGIIDDMNESDFVKLVRQINKNGKTNKEIYYKECRMPWNINSYNIENDNALLKGMIYYIEEGYAELWY